MARPSDTLGESRLLDELTDIFRTVFDDPDLILAEDTTADDIPGWDSMTHIALVVEAECRFAVSFAAAEIEPLQNVGEFVRLIEAKRAAA
ncbi:MAG TPA: acyl carrier protein [Acetobacteraceae bacterium]|nr:acyl carrier protein [Acetobacteraceae bacterium]